MHVGIPGLNLNFCYIGCSGVFHQVSRISSSDVVGPSPIKSEISTMLGSSGSCSGHSSFPIVSSISNAPASSAYPSATIPCVDVGGSIFARHHHSIPSGVSPPEAGGDPIPFSLTPPVLPPHVVPSSAPFGLCVGGFFMQPGAAPTSVATSSGSNSLPTLTPAPDLPTLHLQSLPVVAPPAAVDLGGNVEVTGVPVPPPHGHVFSPIYHRRGTSSGSSLESNSDVNSCTPQSGSKASPGSSSEKKTAEADHS